MAETLEHPLSGRNKGWAVPDFSLEARQLKRSAATTLPVGQFHLGHPALPHRHPDEEKGRSLRTNSRSASTSGLFTSSDLVNRRSWFDSTTAASAQVIQPPALGLAPAAQITGDNNDNDDDDDDALFESWHRDGGARALPDEAADDDFARAPSKSTEQPALAWVPSSWTTAVDKAVMNANGCIQLSGNRLVDIPSLVADLANLRAFETRGSPFSRIQSSPAAAFNLRKSPGRTSSGSFSPAPPFSPSASPTAVPIELHLGNNDITVDAISNSLWTLSNLHVLSLRQNRLDALPEGIGRLTSLHTLNLASNQLKFLPAEILNLDNLAILNLHPNPWLAPPPSATTAPLDPPSQTEAEDSTGTAQPRRRRRRVLGPLQVHFTLPSLEEICIRQLLDPIGPSAELAQPLIKHFYTADYLREVLPPRLNDIFLSIFPHAAANPVSAVSFLRARHLSTSSALSSSSTTAAATSPSPPAPFDPLSHICRSPAHAGLARVFYRPAVERLEWVSEASLKPAAAVVAQPPTSKRSSDVRNIPIRWRGCGPACLDWLEEEDVEEEAQTQSVA